MTHHEPAPDAEPAEPNGIDAQLKALEASLQQAQDQYLRALAETENLRKRHQRDREEHAKFAAERVIRELLPVIDGLDQALVAVDKQSDPQAVIKGVHLIYRQLLRLLEKEGVKRIPTVGQPFDPHTHEAVGHVASGAAKDGSVAEEVHVGYTMHGKVLRPAMVKVAQNTDGQKSDVRDQKSDG